MSRQVAHKQVDPASPAPSSAGARSADYTPRVFGRWVSRALQAYYRGPDHPMKLRFWWGFRRIVNHRRLTIPYGSGGWITVDERDLLQGQIFANGAYEAEVWEALAALAAPGDVVWDAGANIGSFAVRALLDPRVAEVHAFEPDPVSAGILRHNLKLNHGTAYVHDIALGERPEIRPLYRGPSANSGLTGFDNPLGHAEFLVEILPVDELVFERRIAAPTLMKIDVEGWEGRVLRGAGRLLHEAPPRAIVFEAECDAEGNLLDAELSRYLEGHGYTLSRVLRPVGEIEERENYLAVHEAARDS